MNIDRLPGQGEVLCGVLRYVVRVLVHLLQNKLANFLALFILRRSHPCIVKVIRWIVKFKVWFVKYLIAAVSAVVPPLKRPAIRFDKIPRRVTTMPATTVASTAVAASSSAEEHHHHHHQQQHQQEQEDLVAVAMATALMLALITAMSDSAVAVKGRYDRPNKFNNGETKERFTLAELGVQFNKAAQSPADWDS